MLMLEFGSNINNYLTNYYKNIKIVRHGYFVIFEFFFFFNFLEVYESLFLVMKDKWVWKTKMSRIVNLFLSKMNGFYVLNGTIYESLMMDFKRFAMGKKGFK